MQAELPSLDEQKAIGITFTDKPVTVFGGLALFMAFAERVGLQVDQSKELLAALEAQPTLTQVWFLRRVVEA